ncbi:MAG: PDZ domain-containing protein [Myxococcales bacterium]|nr:PDZ domain-containing protein [Myxococcales bacterium]
MNVRLLFAAALLVGASACTEVIDDSSSDGTASRESSLLAPGEVTSVTAAPVTLTGVDVSAITVAAPTGVATVVTPPATEITPVDVPEGRLATVAAQDRDVEFGGVGMMVHMVDGRVAVREVMDGFPAAAAGVEAGMTLLAVDGIDTEGMSVDQFVALVRGDVGEPVALTVASDGVTRTITIEREVIAVTETRCDRIQRTRRETEFGGVGIGLGGGCGGAHIVSVEPGLPGDLAGVTTSDAVVSVDGLDVSGAHVLDIVGAIRGGVGTTVELGLRGADGSVRKVELERVSVVVPEGLGCGQ